MNVTKQHQSQRSANRYIWARQTGLGRRRWLTGMRLVGCLIAGLGLSATLAAYAMAPPDKAVQGLTISSSFATLPRYFEANQGQTAAQVDYLARGPGYSLFLSAPEAVLSLVPQAKAAAAKHDSHSSSASPATGSVLRMQLSGANSAAKAVAQEPLAGHSNYLIGKDPKQWHTDIPLYAKIKYQQVYPGIDVVYYGKQNQLEYDFVVAPGADPKTIALKFSDAGKLALDPQGNLLVPTATGALQMRKPVVYQEVNGVRKEVAGTYVLRNEREAGFHVAAYDTSRPLIIDPVLSYLIAGVNDTTGASVTVDANGNVYVIGNTTSTAFPTLNPLQSSFGGGYTDAFVAKWSAAGTLLYATYLGGTGSDRGTAIVADANGNAFIAGQTDSTNFPLANPVQASRGDSYYADAFVAQLNAAGSALIYSTYLGGSAPDGATGIALDIAGNVYITGQTSSSNFPTARALQPLLGGGGDAFITKLDVSGALVYSTYLGGSSNDAANGIAVDATGNIYVTGSTYSSNFPVMNPLRATRKGSQDAFISKLDPGGAALVYSTYLDYTVGTPTTANNDTANGIAVDANGNAVIVGTTINYWYSSRGTKYSGYTAFAAKFNAAGSAQIYYVPLGSQDGRAVAVDGNGNAYLTGKFSGPLVNPMQAVYTEAAIAKLNPAGGFLYSSYLGPGDIYGAATYGIAVDTSGINAYVTGSLRSASYNPFQLMVAKIADITTTADLSLRADESPNIVLVNSTLTYTVYINNTGPEPATGVRLNYTPPAGVTLVSASSFSGRCSVTSTVVCEQGNVGIGTTASSIVTIVVKPTVAGTLTSTFSVSTTGIESNPANNSVSEVATVTSSVPVDLQVSQSAAPNPVAIGQQLTYTLTVKNASDLYDASNVVLTDTLPAGVDFVSITPTYGGWACSQANGTVTCNIGYLLKTGKATFTMVVTPNATAAGSITNTASVTTSSYDTNTSNNTSSAATTVTGGNTTPPPPPPPPPPPTGTTYTLQVAVSGSGTLTATGINCPGDCSEVYASGTSVTITATPAAGWHVDQWESACAGVTGTSCTVTVNKDLDTAVAFLPN